MKRMHKDNIKNKGNAALLTALLIPAIMFPVAAFKKKDYVYDNAPEEKNPHEGKRVVLVNDVNDAENADGIKGHLEDCGVSEYHPGFYEKYIKRLFDLSFSFGGLVVLSPLMALIALAIKVEDPGPAIFTQKRIGQNKKYFKLHKFRSMKLDTPQNVPTHQLKDPDRYFTRVGSFIRAHSLDELPQLWDIFVGNMSLVGPRPGLWNQDHLISERDRYGANDVRPGLTGPAQLSGRDELDIIHKARYDGEYVDNIGWKTDLKCLFKSFRVFFGDDSIVEGNMGKAPGSGPEKEQRICI